MVENLPLAENENAARQAWLEKLSEFGHVGQIYSWLITDENVADRVHCALRRVYDHYYGGSDFFACLSGYIPLVFRALSHLVADVADFETLAARMPEILKALPSESFGHLDGTDYTFDTTQLQQRAMQAETVAGFLADFSQRLPAKTVDQADSALKPDTSAWESEFAEELAELDRLGMFLVDSTGKDLAGKVSQRYAHALSDVIQSRQDVQALVALLRDAATWHKISGDYKWPVRVFPKAIAVMADPVSQLRKIMPVGSVLTAALGESPSLCLRFLAMPDSGLIRNVIAQLPIIDPLLSSSQAAADFVNLLVLMNFNFNIYCGSFLAAMPEIAAAIGQSDGAAAFSLAREMLVAKHCLCYSDDWLSPLCEVVRAAPKGEPAVLKDIVK
ncbi:MAG TPA: hypothetical protein DCG57_04035, partial [Candidatus Riflebacteria bacterium]|nr:hypothetical protein [Candidatus Riflebacteria bacterium]